jgi:4-amino-4-deoxy-L-arabinose transferase-like glycosyltransferase
MGGLSGGTGVGGKRARIIVLILVLHLATLLRFCALDVKCLWQDEASTLKHATAAGVPELLSSVLDKALPAPPLYFLVSHILLPLGDADFVLRFPSVAFGVLAVAGVYALGKAMFGELEGLAAALLLAISPSHIRYSQEARPYAVFMLLSLLGLLFLWMGLRGRGVKWWMGFAFCTTLNLYTHLFAVLVLLAETVFVLGLWQAVASQSVKGRFISKSRSSPEKNGRTSDISRFVGFVVSLVITALACAPMLGHLWRGVTGRKGLGGEATGGLSFTPPFLIQMIDFWGIGSGWLLVILLVLFVLGVIASASRQRRQLWLALCWFAIPFGMLFALPAQHGFRPRYVLFMLPLYLLFAARGVTAGSEVVSSRLLGEKPELRNAPLVISLLVIAAASIPTVWGYYAEDRADWRAVAGLLARSMSSADVISSPGVFPRLLLPRYAASLTDAVFVSRGQDIFLSSDDEGPGGFWFVGYAREQVLARHTEVIAATPSHFRVIFEVDDQRAARGRALNIAPVMYDDVFALYVRTNLQRQEVIQMYEEALEVVPSAVVPSIHVALGDLYRTLLDLDKAAIHFGQAAVLDPMAAEPHYGLALVYRAQGMQEQYESEWETYKELAAQQ